MTMSRNLRKFTFTTHVTSSLGWVGAVITFLAMAVIALTSRDERTVRGAYLVMAPAAWFVLVPLAHASLLSGVVLSLGTTWGLFRYYWVVLKLGITMFCTVILLIYMGTFREMAGIAADPVVNLDAIRNASPVLHASVALVLLLIATALGVYKPLGLTAYGRRVVFPADAPLPSSDRRASWAPYLVVGVVALFLLLIVLHVLGGGAHGH